MPPVLAALPAIIGAVATAFGVSQIVVAIITIAASLAVSLLTKKPKQNKLNQGAELSTRIDPTMTRQVLCGNTASGGSCHFAFTNTDNYKKPNRYLYRVIQISDQPIDSLVGIYDGNTLVGFSGDVTTGWRASTQYTDKSGNPCCWVRVYLGVHSGAVADATLISATGGIWTSSHKGTGLAYAIIKMDSNADAFPNGEPQFVFVVNGAHCYDDRLDSTKPGGSGTQRVNDPTTWAYSDTCSVITAQFLRGFKINGVRILGVGAEERDLSTTMLFSAHNTCDQVVTTNAGTAKRYVAGMIMSASDQAASILEDLQAAMDGKIFDRGGAITILPGANRTPVMNLTDNDIIWTEQKSWQPKPSLDVMMNCVTANYIDKEKNFQEQDLPVLSNSSWEIDDGGERFTSFFSFRAVNSREQGMRITKRLHQASRYGGTVAFIGSIWLIEMEQGDWFTLTSARWGFTSKYFEIQEITLTKDMRVAIVGREVDPSSDEWDHSVDEVPRTDTVWTPPSYDIPSPTISAAPFTYIDPVTGLQVFAVDLSVPALDFGSFIKRVYVEYRKYGSTEWSDGGSFAIDQLKTTIRGLEAGTTYEYHGRLSDGVRTGLWTTPTTFSTSASTPLTQVNIPPVTTLNQRSRYQGQTITYSATAGTPATATISVSAFTALMGSRSVSYSASSAGVTGTGGVTTTFYLYFDDSGYAGGTKTLHATTDPNDLFTADGRVWVGNVDIAFPTSGSGSGGGSGGGGGGCVAETSWMDDERQAWEFNVGEIIWLPAEGMTTEPAVPAVVKNCPTSLQPCYRLTTESGAWIVASASTPMDLRDGRVCYFNDMLGEEVLVDRHGVIQWEKVTALDPVGTRRVVWFYVDDRMYFAGGERGVRIATHNLLPDKAIS